MRSASSDGSRESSTTVSAAFESCWAKLPQRRPPAEGGARRGPSRSASDGPRSSAGLAGASFWMLASEARGPARGRPAARTASWPEASEGGRSLPRSSGRGGKLDAQGREAGTHPLGQEADACQVVHHGVVHVPAEVLPIDRIVVLGGDLAAVGPDLVDLCPREAYVAVGLHGEEARQDLLERHAGVVLHLTPL